MTYGWRKPRLMFDIGKPVIMGILITTELIL